MSMQLKLHNSAGEIIIGGESNIHATRITGLGAPAYERLLFTSYDFDGAVEGARRIGTRRINISGELLRSQPEAVRMMRVLSRPCKLTVLPANREITVNAAECDFSDRNNVYQKFILALDCDDPYFYDAEEIRKGLYGINKLITDETVLPAVFSTRTDSTRVEICGDRPAEPIIEILGGEENDGAEGNITIENITNGTSFTLLYVPQKGERLTIDVAARTAFSELNGNIIKYLSPDSFMSDLELCAPYTDLKTIGSGAAGQMSAYVRYKNKYIEAFI